MFIHMSFHKCPLALDNPFLLFPDCMCPCEKRPQNWKCWCCTRTFWILCSSPEDLRHLLRHHRQRGQQRVAHLHGQWETRAIHFLETHHPIRWVYFTSRMPILMKGREGEGEGPGWWIESGYESAARINSVWSVDMGNLIVVPHMWV